MQKKNIIEACTCTYHYEYSYVPVPGCACCNQCHRQIRCGAEWFPRGRVAWCPTACNSEHARALHKYAGQLTPAAHAKAASHSHCVPTSNETTPYVNKLKNNFATEVNDLAPAFWVTQHYMPRWTIMRTQWLCLCDLRFTFASNKHLAVKSYSACVHLSLRS